jgi:aryl-alcohol dehydrogenase-like predicted oxidoreductase
MSDMTYRQLGDSGLTVSTIGLGCNQIGGKLDLDATRTVVEAAIDVGITLFDTADMYGAEPGASESLLGQALVGRRDRVVVATKFGMSMRGTTLPEHEARGSRRYIRASIEASLRRLRTDHVDLYQMHEPDPRTPIEETLDALGELVRDGKVRYLGSSNFTGWQIVDADWVARTSAGAPSHQRAERIQPARTRRRDRGHSSRRKRRGRRHSVLPARTRAAERQVPTRQAGAGRKPTR